MNFNKIGGGEIKEIDDGSIVLDCRKIIYNPKPVFRFSLIALKN